MSHHPELDQWIGIVSSHFPRLSKPLATGLALWSFGMIVARSCGLTAVAGILAPLLGQPFNTLRERLRDTYREADAKAGSCRAHLEVSDCWAPWLAWVLEGWSGRQLAIAIDATTLGQRFVVLAISVVYRGCAVPVAWKILRATEKHPWQPEWLALLERFRGVVPAGWVVIVLADRGLYAKWLFQAIGALGWHPLLRVNQQGTFRPQGWYHWVPFRQLVPAVGRRWAGQGTAFHGKHTRLECTLLACWDVGHQEAWLMLTDLPPHAADACWYGLRAWIEQGFKRIKRGGWQWQYTRMEDPARAERLWLALALATWWLLSIGGEAEAALLAETLPPVPGAARRQGKGWRLIGVFRRGWNLIMAALLTHQPLPMGQGAPEPWPVLPVGSETLSVSTP
jgi:hypothetical protein